MLYNHQSNPNRIELAIVRVLERLEVLFLWVGKSNKIYYFNKISK